MSRTAAAAAAIFFHMVCAYLASAQPKFSDPPEGTPERAVWDLLEAMHTASHNADPAYFDLFADDAVFFGTDLWERWPKDEFEALYKPYMESGRGWTLKLRNRHIAVQPCETIALFDETLFSDSFGPCRGSGAARLDDGEWRIVRYHLDITIPNGVVDEVVEDVAAFNARRLDLVFGELPEADVAHLSPMLKRVWPDIALFVHRDEASLNAEAQYFYGYDRMTHWLPGDGFGLRINTLLRRFGVSKHDSRLIHGTPSPLVMTYERSVPAGPDIQIIFDDLGRSPALVEQTTSQIVYIGNWVLSDTDDHLEQLLYDGVSFDQIVIPRGTTVERAERLQIGGSEAVRVVLVFTD